MSGISQNVTGTIGKTPIVLLNSIGQDLPGRVAVKLESRNPGGSVKDRIGWGMISDAEEAGLITPGKTTIIEPTSGNTGIALALIGAARGYRVILTMPESMSIERRKLLRAHGAELVLTPKERGMAGAVEAAEQLVEETADAWLPNQFGNPSNPRAHYRTTGPELIEALAGEKFGAFVAGVGTGGTISGGGRYIKEQDSSVRIIAVEPQESQLIAQRLRGDELAPAPHLIQGMGANFIPDTLDLDVLDGVEAVSGEQAIECARELAAKEGLLVGISTGANVVAALRLAALDEMAGKLVVTVAPSTGERYLSTKLWEGLE